MECEWSRQMGRGKVEMYGTSPVLGESVYMHNRRCLIFHVHTSLFSQHRVNWCMEITKCSWAKILSSFLNGSSKVVMRSQSSSNCRSKSTSQTPRLSSHPQSTYRSYTNLTKESPSSPPLLPLPKQLLSSKLALPLLTSTGGLIPLA